MLRKYEQGGQGRRGTSPSEDAGRCARVYIRAGRAGSCELGELGELVIYARRSKLEELKQQA